MHVGLSNRIPRTLPCSGGCEPAPSNDRKHDSGFLAVVHKHFEFIQNNESLEGHVQKKGAAVLLRDGVQLAMFTAQAVPISFDADTAHRWLHYCKATTQNFVVTSQSVQYLVFISSTVRNYPLGRLRETIRMWL